MCVCYRGVCVFKHVTYIAWYTIVVHIHRSIELYLLYKSNIQFIVEKNTYTHACIYVYIYIYIYIYICFFIFLLDHLTGID